MSTSSMQRRGVSLLELLAVVTLLGIFAAIATGRYGRSIFAEVGAQAEARKLSLALLGAKRSSISTGQNHYVEFNAAQATSYRLMRRGGAGPVEVQGWEPISDDATISVSSTLMEFNWEGGALDAYTIDCVGVDRSYRLARCRSARRAIPGSSADDSRLRSKWVDDHGQAEIKIETAQPDGHDRDHANQARDDHRGKVSRALSGSGPSPGLAPGRWFTQHGRWCTRVNRCAHGAGYQREKENLNGAKVHLALSSDFCITRVLAGEIEKVQAEVRNLHERVGQYLLLGAGEKAIAESARPIDAKQAQAWVTVTNERTLNDIVQAVHDAGLQVALIEHAMVAMCRAVGRMGRDTSAPVVIAEVNNQGVNIGVSYRGQLLFDYRPGGVDSKGKLAEIVQRHLQRIQRYCDRQFRFAQGEIKQVFLCGSSSDLDPLLQQFSETTDLAAEVLDPKKICPEWEYDESAASDLGFFSAIGSALVDPEQLEEDSSERGLPNLMDYYLGAQRAPLVPALLKSTWPIAAAVLLGVGIYGAAFMKDGQVAAVAAQKQQFDQQLGQVRTMKIEADAAKTNVGWLSQINERRTNPAWHDLITMVGHAMPEGVWLNSLRVQGNGAVHINGPSQTEDLVSEFVNHLKKVPVLKDVTLERQSTAHTQRGQTIVFDVECRYAAEEELTERTASND